MIESESIFFIAVNKIGYLNRGHSSSLDLPLLCANLGAGICHLNSKLLSSSHKGSFLLSADIVGDLGTERPIVHEQHFQIFIIPDQELLESVGQVILSSLVAAKTHFGHSLVTPELSPHAIVNTCDK
jgi:hypothetical protein